MTTKRITLFLAQALLLLAVPIACDDDESGTDDGAMGDDSGGPATGDADDGDADDGDADDGDADDGDADDGGEVDNMAACESLLNALECGSFDLSDSVPCEQYSSLTCDLADYFGCLEDNFTCNDGVFDPTSWTMCAELATCA